MFFVIVFCKVFLFHLKKTNVFFWISFCNAHFYLCIFPGEKELLEPEKDEELMEITKKVAWKKGREPTTRFTCCGRGLHGPCLDQCIEDNVNQCMTKSKCPACGKKYKKRGSSAEAKLVVKWVKCGAEWASQWLVDEAGKCTK